MLIASESGAWVWNWATDEVLLSLNPEEGAAYVEESPNGKTAAHDRRSNFPRTTVQVWDRETGAELAAFEAAGRRALGARFPPDGNRVVTYSYSDRALHMWDARTGEELFQLEGHRGRVPDAAFSPDGLLLASASTDRTARLWDAATGDELAVLGPHLGPLSGIVFSPDGAGIATFGSGGARVWQAGPRFHGRERGQCREFRSRVGRARSTHQHPRRRLGARNTRPGGRQSRDRSSARGPWEA